MLHVAGKCREQLRLKRYALMMMQRLWTGAMRPYLETLPPNSVKAQIIERDFQMLMDVLEPEDHECEC